MPGHALNHTISSLKYLKSVNSRAADLDAGAFSLRDRGAFRYLESFALGPVANMPAIEIVTPARTYHVVGAKCDGLPHRVES